MVAQMTYVAPSLLAADFSALGAELKKVREAEILHIDIMDGNFVPIDMGPQVVKARREDGPGVRPAPDAPPPPAVRAHVPGGRAPIGLPSTSSATTTPGTVLASIEASGAKPGIAIKPGTPVESSSPLGSSCTT